MAVSEEVAQQLLGRWSVWQTNRPSHQRLFFSFFEEVVRQEDTLREISLLDVLSVLNTTVGISPETN
ncbi:MAG: hypothetical protein FJ194_06760 [Gammaproteobacteria bacterium]|nr:hypothetical protein [Gammaproteobacteria bacterium]